MINHVERFCEAQTPQHNWVWTTVRLSVPVDGKMEQSSGKIRLMSKISQRFDGNWTTRPLSMHANGKWVSLFTITYAIIDFYVCINT